MDVSIILCVLLVVLTIVKFIKNKKVYEAVDLIPGPRAYPVIGNIMDLAVPREKMMMGMVERHRKFGPIYRMWVGGVPVVHVSMPEFAEVLLNSSKHTRKGNFYRFLLPWLGTGLLTSSGGKWFSHRKLITPTFHFRILESFLEVFNENAEVLLRRIQRQAAKGEVFDVYPFITLCALDIICETAMGTRVNAQMEQSSPYVSAVYKISELTVDRSMKPWLHPGLLYFNLPPGRQYKRSLRVLHGFTENVIKERKESRSKKETMADKNMEEDEIGTKKRQAFLDLLLDAAELEQNKHLSDSDIREEVDTFMFEGHDTTTASICWALHSLGVHHHIQEALQEEFKLIFGEDRTRVPTMRDLGEMKLLERVIKETLRLYPSVSFLSRRLDEDVQLGKFRIPAETTLAVNIFCMHRNPSVFTEPEKFDPDRFLPENMQERHPYSYIPFSAGPRNCIGQRFALLEEKVILSTILRNFKVEAVQHPEDLTFMMELILRPLEGIKLRLIKRE